jgi:hypothetical protein
MDRCALYASAVWPRLYAWLRKLLAWVGVKLGFLGLHHRSFYRGLRLQPVQSKAGSWSTTGNSRHLLAKPNACAGVADADQRKKAASEKQACDTCTRWTALV